MRKTVLIATVVATVFMMTGIAFAAPVNAAAQKAISKSEAKSIALKDAGVKKSQVKKFEAEYEKKDNTYEVEFTKKKDKTEFDYEISAADGMILEKSVEFRYKHNKSKDKIGKDAARKIAADHSGVSLSDVKEGSCTYRYKHHEGEYKVKFRSGSYKYEYEILSPNGTIMEYEYEYK